MTTVAPPGLECLASLDALCVEQMVELFQALTGFDTKNKYKILNPYNGSVILFAAEQSGFITRLCLSSIRPFRMSIMDHAGNEVLYMTRELNCDNCCCPCCLQTMQVYAQGNLLGSLKQRWHCLPRFDVLDPNGEVILKIKGPFIVSSLARGCRPVPFEIYSKDGKQKLGEIQKKWSGTLREMLTNADFFGINFPISLDIRAKATLLGALFLIDYVYFEST